MNRKHILFSATLLLGIGVWAQKSKTYTETFTVVPEAVVDINTSHADIEFETWNKNQVEIIAKVTLEDASDEDIEAYFKKEPVSISGNSKEIEIKTNSGTSWLFANGNNQFDFDDFDVQFDVEPFFLDLNIPDLPELAVLPELPFMPPLPPMNFKSFDYEQYQEEGNAYLEEWAEGFQEGFGEDYKKKMKDWGKRVEERAKAWEERNAERLKEREKMMEERAKAMEERAAEWEERRAEVEERRREAVERLAEAREKAKEKERNTLFLSNGDDSNIFFISSDGENKSYKVKKTIKIKMPKSVKLKMNVKHGEVKLASITKDLNASLRHASLLASNIEGEETSVHAAYTPIVVQNWSVGQLKADYSENINLKRVGELRLNAVSSNVTIDQLRGKALVKNNLGKLLIQDVQPSFSDLDVSVQNGEVVCKVPAVPISFYLNGTQSTMDFPTRAVVERLTNFDNVVYKGFLEKENADKRITINSKYSEVVLKD